MTGSGAAFTSRRQLLERYPHVREDHLRYMQKWGLVRPELLAGSEERYSFADLDVIRQADEGLAGGSSFRAVLRHLLASRSGQLTLDFRFEVREEYIALAMIDGRLRAVSLAADGTYSFVDPFANLHSILYVGSETIELSQAINELEDLMNAAAATERDFQLFFERHPDFILTDDQ